MRRRWKKELDSEKEEAYGVWWSDELQIEQWFVMVIIKVFVQGGRSSKCCLILCYGLLNIHMWTFPETLRRRGGHGKNWSSVSCLMKMALTDTTICGLLVWPNKLLLACRSFQISQQQDALYTLVETKEFSYMYVFTFCLGALRIEE